MLAYLFTYLFTYFFIYLLAYLFICLLAYVFIYLLTNLLTCLLNWFLFCWEILLLKQPVIFSGEDKRNTYVDTTKKRCSK